MKLIYILVFFLFVFPYASSQGQSLINQVQYGASLKAKIEFSPNSKNEPTINFRVSSNIGAASMWLIEDLYPSINGEIQLYNGGLGSRSKSGNRYFSLDGILAFTLTAGHLHNSFKNNLFLINRNNPLRYFADFANPSLQNPYNYSMSLGTNLVFSTDGARSFQRLGFLNLNHSGVQLSYYNDGTPFQHILLGDGKDRFYTGGGVLSYNKSFGTYEQFNSYSLEVSYHKFSGYNESSFELANSINASNVDYKEKYQSEFNKSLWKFNLLTSKDDTNLGLALSFYNSTKFDGQHLIHWLINNSFHLVPYAFYYTIEPSISITNTKFNNR